jgi:methylenetetrahydrofolate reductase (NADPH)
MHMLADKIAARKFVVTAELTPPKGVDLTELFAKAEMLKPHVDAINLTDSPRARMTVEPKAVGHLLLDRGIEPIIQITARDRNRIAIQSDLLGGALLGLNSYVFMNGDQPKGGDHADAKGVFDWSASDMLLAARALNEGRDAGGAEIKGRVHLFVGATANPAAHDFKREVENTKRKIDAGAQFLQTQALYDAAALEKFLEAVKPDGVAILAGVIPLKSHKMAVWLNENVPGIRVPAALLKEMSAVSHADHETQTGVDIAARIIRTVKPLCAGVHIMAMGWEQHIPAILKASGVR